MSAPVDVLKAMRVAEAYCYDAGASNAAQNMKAARAAVAELIEAARTFCSGMPLQYAENAKVVGNCNAREIENMREALAKCGGAS